MLNSMVDRLQKLIMGYLLHPECVFFCDGELDRLLDADEDVLLVENDR